MDRTDLYPIGYLLLLRLKIGIRFLKALGWIRSIVILMMLLTFLTQVLAEEHAALFLTAFGLIVILGIHFNRKDQHFVQSLGVGKHHLFIVEYILISFPVIILLAWLGAWLCVFLLICGSAAIALLPIFDSANSTEEVRSLPLFLPFEWISGLRRQKWMPIPLVVIALIIAPFYLFAGWIFLFLLTMTVAQFYTHCESISFILFQQDSPAAFLSHKIRQGVGGYSLLTGLVWIEIMVLYPAEAFGSLLFLLADLLLVITVIAGKYAFYRENTSIEVMNGTIFGIACLCLLVPYLLPVFILLFIWLFWRAGKRLKYEVYAFH